MLAERARYYLIQGLQSAPVVIAALTAFLRFGKTDGGDG